MRTETPVEQAPETVVALGLIFQKTGQHTAEHGRSSREYEYEGIVLTRTFNCFQQVLVWKARYTRGPNRPESALNITSAEEALRSLLNDAGRQLSDTERHYHRAKELLDATEVQFSRLQTLIEG